MRESLGSKMESVLPANLELVTTLASHCLRRTSEAVQQTRATLQQAIQPLPPGFPPGPDGDVALELAQNPLQCLESLKSRYGSLVGFKLASRPIVLVSSPWVFPVLRCFPTIAPSRFQLLFEAFCVDSGAIVSGSAFHISVCDVGSSRDAEFDTLWLVIAGFSPGKCLSHRAAPSSRSSSL